MTRDRIALWLVCVLGVAAAPFSSAPAVERPALVCRIETVATDRGGHPVGAAVGIAGATKFVSKLVVASKGRELPPKPVRYTLAATVEGYAPIPAIGGVVEVVNTDALATGSTVLTFSVENPTRVTVRGKLELPDNKWSTCEHRFTVSVEGKRPRK